MSKELHSMRESYELKILTEDNIHADPIIQFGHWFEEAKKASILEPNAMILSTSTSDGIPSSRTVLLKEFDQSGFIFYTNYTSDKGAELESNPQASLLFLWKELQRQVRISGAVIKVSKQKSVDYFNSRPKGSRIGALVSDQSKVIKSRSILESKNKELQEKYKTDENIPCPDHWGGYQVVPNRIEFWQGRPNRLHDRLCFLQNQNREWEINRLAP